MSSRPSDPTGAVVISGIGLATALGPTAEKTWAGLIAGRSGARFLDDRSPDLREYAGFPLELGPWSDSFEPVVSLLQTLAVAALDDAGLDRNQIDRDRVGVLAGLSKGGLRGLRTVQEITRFGATNQDQNDSRIADAWSLAWPNAGAAAIARHLDLRGPCLAPVAACATGLIAALQGADLIRRGVCDVVLVGSADLSLDPLILGAFRRMKVLARVNRDPARAVRPWSRDRTGFLVGEGGAILILERAEAVVERGGTAYAQLAGGAIGSDAFHETNLNPDPAGFARLITRALKLAEVDPAEVTLVNVHGTATGSNDPLECRALHRVFGAGADRLACSANKAQVGHLLGAAGSVELAITALSIRHGFAPPTLNLDDPDPACNLDATPHQGRTLDVPAALKLSLGFGGHLAAAVLRRVNVPGPVPVSVLTGEQTQDQGEPKRGI